MSDSPISIVSCNVRGFRRYEKRKILLNLFKSKKTDILALQETYITEDDVEDWKKHVRGCHFLYSPGTKNSKGLITVFGQSFEDPEQIFRNDRVLITKAKRSNYYYIIINIYAPSDNEPNKINFIKSLNSIIANQVANQLTQENTHLVVLGDCNCVCSNDLDIISGIKHNVQTVRTFNEFITTNDLFDTWRLFHQDQKESTWKRTSNSLVARRLDYILVDQTLLAKTLGAEIFTVPMTDHRAVKITCESKELPRGPSYYKFNDSLLTNIQFLDTINNLIATLKIKFKDFDPIDKWEIIKSNIKEKSMEFSKNLAKEKEETVIEVESRINHLERSLCLQPNNAKIIKDLNEEKLKYEIMLESKRKGAAIRSKSKWIENGERSTKFFFSLEKSRKKQNTLTQVDTLNGKVDKVEDISLELHKFFKELYSCKSQHNFNELNDFHSTLDIPKLCNEEKDFIDKPLTIDEIGRALQKMNNGSSPGLDGLTTSFYKTFWLHLKDILFDSFNHSISLGRLATSQTLGVTSLLHKGKDLSRSKLSNWRPITVTNTDYKIIAKAVAERLKLVLPSIISDTQYGFMKNRNSAQMLRQIDNITEYAELTKIKGYILAIDFHKCFDSVSHKYIVYALSKFGFGDYIIGCIKMLMVNGKSCINNGGWLTPFYELEQGLKQGCPCSPLTYLIVAELLALKLKQNNIFKGIEIHGVAYKILQYADDTNIFFRDLIDYREILSKIKDFAKFSGLKLNSKKSNIMPISTYTNELENTQEIPYRESIKILGVNFKVGIPAGQLKENWNNIVEKIDRQIKNWSHRDLTIQGKILVVKTFLLSQCNYIMQSIGLPEHVLNTLNTKLFSFIWKKKHSNRRAIEKISRKVLCSSVENGGLKMIDLRLFQESTYVSWAASLVGNKVSEMEKHIPLLLLTEVDGTHIFQADPAANDIPSILEKIKSQFWKDVVLAWFKHKNPKEEDEKISTYIWNNRHFMYKNKTLFFKNWAKVGIRYFHDLTTANNKIITYETLQSKIINNPALIFQYNAVKIAHAEFIKNKANINSDQGYYFKNINVSTTKIKAKQIRQLIQNENTPIVHSVNTWKNKRQAIIDPEIWLSANKATKEIRLRMLHFKICHNIYGTNIVLKKMKITNTDLCRQCHQSREYIEHFFVECPKLDSFWSNVRRLIGINFNKSIQIDNNDILFGLKKTSNLNLKNKEYNTINHILLVGKMVISKYNYYKRGDLMYMFLNECHIRNISIQE